VSSNEIPDDIWSTLPHGEYIPYSFDVTADGKLGIIVLCSEDIESPEIWVFNKTEKPTIRVDGYMLVDFPISKAFWAENQRDVIVVTYDKPVEFSLLKISNETGVCDSIDVIDGNLEYIKDKFSKVFDFTREGFKHESTKPDIEVGNMNLIL